MLLSNESPTYAMYRALNSSRILPADKKPGMTPLAAGESLMRLISACNIAQTGNQTVSLTRITYIHRIRTVIFQGNFLNI